MPRKTTGSGFESATSRSKLKHQGNPYRFRLERGLSIGYYRPEDPRTEGSWVALGYDPRAIPREPRKTLGLADDFKEADGVQVLDWKQAQEKAREWFAALKRGLDQPGEPVQAPPKVPRLVNDAWDEYIQDGIGRGVRGIKNMCQCYDAHVRHVIGVIELEKLTRHEISSWLLKLGNTPRRTGKDEPLEGETTVSKRKRRHQENKDVEKTENQPQKPFVDPLEVARKRKNSVNRIYTDLKSALNFVWNTYELSMPKPWQKVPSFQEVDVSRIRTLEENEQLKLIEACTDELRPLVIAAMFTGARYGELNKVRVYDLKGDVLHINYGKGKRGYVPRDVMLGPKAAAWFKSHVQGRSRDEPMFLRVNVLRTKRKEELAGSVGWARYDQKYLMEKAVKMAGIDRVTFHELRHTYASDQLNRGMNLAYVAKQLGHKDLRMVTKYYGHIADAVMRAAVNMNEPLQGFKITVG